MNPAPSYPAVLVERIGKALTTISQLAELLPNNDAHDIPLQINDVDESVLKSAIQLLVEMAHRDFCELASDLEIPI